MRSRWFRLAVVALLFCILYGMFKNVSHLTSSWEDWVAALSRFRVPTLLYGLACYCSHQFFCAVRLFCLASSRERVPFRQVLYASAMGQLTNAFVPARAGDAVKAMNLSRVPSGQSALRNVGILVLDRVADFSAFVSVTLVSGSFLFVPTSWLRFEKNWGVLAGGSVAVVLLLVFARARWGTWLKERLRPCIEGFRSVRPSRFLLAVLMGSIAVCSEAQVARVLCEGQGFSLTLPQGLFVLIALNFVTFFPITPGEVGAYELAIAVALQQFGVPMATALAVGILMHASQYSSVVLCGALTWTHRRIEKLVRRASPEAPSVVS